MKKVQQLGYLVPMVAFGILSVMVMFSGLMAAFNTQPVEAAATVEVAALPLSMDTSSLTVVVAVATTLTMLARTAL